MKTNTKYIFALSIALIIIGSVLTGTSFYMNQTENNFYESIETNLETTFVDIIFINLTYFQTSEFETVNGSDINDIDESYFDLKNWTYGFSENKKNFIEIKVWYEFRIGKILDFDEINAFIYINGKPYRYDIIIFNSDLNYIKVFFLEHYSYFTGLSKPFWI